MNGINGTVQANGISGVLGYTREELTMGLNTERMAAIIDLLGGDSTTLPNNLYSTYLNEIIRLLQEGGESQEERFQEILAEYEELKAIISPYITDSAVLGVQVDYENKTYTRLANAFGRNAGADFDGFPMFGGRRRCNVADDGTINAFYGDTGYKEDGSNGQVMVYQPSFWYKVVPLKLERQTDGVGYHLRKANYFVTATKHDGFKLHPAFLDANGNPVDYILMGAYEGCLYDTSAAAYILDDAQVMDAAADKFSSIAGAKPASGLTQNLICPNIEAMAALRGTGWHSDFVQVASANQLLMMIEHGTMELQGAVGKGVVDEASGSDNESHATGATAALGNSTGMAPGTNGKTSVTYRGVENPWGNIWKFIYGVNIWGDGTMKGGVPFICTNHAFAESKKDGNYKSAGFSVTNDNGYISAMGYGNEEFDWLFMASETAGNSALPVGDYTYITANLNGYRIARLGSYWTYGARAGGFYWYLADGVGARYRNAGGRLVFIPTAKAA